MAAKPLLRHLMVEGGVYCTSRVWIRAHMQLWPRTLEIG